MSRDTQKTSASTITLLGKYTVLSRSDVKALVRSYHDWTPLSRQQSKDLNVRQYSTLDSIFRDSQHTRSGFTRSASASLKATQESARGDLYADFAEVQQETVDIKPEYFSELEQVHAILDIAEDFSFEPLLSRDPYRKDAILPKTWGKLDDWTLPIVQGMVNKIAVYDREERGLCQTFNTHEPGRLAFLDFMRRTVRETWQSMRGHVTGWLDKYQDLERESFGSQLGRSTRLSSILEDEAEA